MTTMIARHRTLLVAGGLLVAAASIVPISRAAASPAITRCTSHQVKASYRGGQGAAGHILGKIALKNTSNTRCFVKGFGKVAYVSGRIGHQVGHASTRDNGVHVQKVILRPGDMATSGINETEAGNYPAATCKPVHVPGIDVWVPGGSGVQFIRHPTTACKSFHVHLISHRAYR